MKNFLSWAIIFVFIIAIFVSCERSDEPSMERDIGLEIATENLNQFIHFLYPSTRSEGLNIEITNSYKKRIAVEREGALKTRSGFDGDKDYADLYTLSFTFKGKEGFAIVSGDEKVSNLYAFTEEGNIADTATIFGLKQAVEGIEELYQREVLEAYYGDPDSITTRSSVMPYAANIGPFTGLKWGQEAPYNADATVNCSLPGYGGKAPAGCVPVAYAMAIAYCESNRAMDVNQVHLFNRKAKINTWDPEAPLVAKLMYDVGFLCNINYTCDGSGTDVTAGQKAFVRYMLIHSHSSGVNTNYMKTSLNDGYPVIMGGHPSSGAGHAWMVEGGITDSNGNYTHYYNNWGWSGRNDGFFAIGDFLGYTRNNQYIYVHDVVKF